MTLWSREIPVVQIEYSITNKLRVINDQFIQPLSLIPVQYLEGVSLPVENLNPCI